MISPAVGTKGVPRPVREHQIVAVAIEEFAAHGYANASVLKIAKLAGISKPLIYQYFGSKDGLFRVCLQQVGEGLLERLRHAVLEVDDTVTSRVHLLSAVFMALEPQPVAWRLLFDDSMPQVPEILAAAQDYRSAVRTLAMSGSQRFLLSRGIDSSLDASALARIWLGVVDSAVRWWLTHPEESAQAMSDRCARLLSAVADDGPRPA